MDVIPTKEKTMIIMPQVKRTGEVAMIEATCRASKTVPGTATIQLALPARSLVVSDGQQVMALPRTPAGEGLAVARFRAVMN